MWQAEHGRKRRTGRVVVRAMAAFMEAGGNESDIAKLKLTALGRRIGLDFDPLGLAETANTTDETILLTSELLTEILLLVHPDKHLPERHEAATRVTQQLLALQPFVFPAVKPEPVTPCEPTCNASVKAPADTSTEPLRRYRCAECASTIPLNYCAVCRAEWEKKQREERERINAKQRQWYARRRAWRVLKACEACGGAVKGKRRDARFCSAACRQKTHRAIRKAFLGSLGGRGAWSVEPFEDTS
jgi:hypothetical protein